MTIAISIVAAIFIVAIIFSCIRPYDGPSAAAGSMIRVVNEETLISYGSMQYVSDKKWCKLNKATQRLNSLEVNSTMVAMDMVEGKAVYAFRGDGNSAPYLTVSSNGSDSRFSFSGRLLYDVRFIDDNHIAILGPHLVTILDISNPSNYISNSMEVTELSGRISRVVNKNIIADTSEGYPIIINSELVKYKKWDDGLDLSQYDDGGTLPTRCVYGANRFVINIRESFYECKNMGDKWLKIPNITLDGVCRGIVIDGNNLIFADDAGVNVCDGQGKGKCVFVDKLKDYRLISGLALTNEIIIATFYRVNPGKYGIAINNSDYSISEIGINK